MQPGAWPFSRFLFYTSLRICRIFITRDPVLLVLKYEWNVKFKLQSDNVVDKNTMSSPFSKIHALFPVSCYGYKMMLWRKYFKGSRRTSERTWMKSPRISLWLTLTTKVLLRPTMRSNRESGRSKSYSTQFIQLLIQSFCYSSQI